MRVNIQPERYSMQYSQKIRTSGVCAIEKVKGSSLLIALAVSNVTIIKDRISRWLVSGNDALSATCKEVLI